jgi:hypothetical protein
MCETAVTLHPFEQAGLGKAPFRYLGSDEKRTKSGQPAGTCDYCYRGILTCCVIGSADGKSFVVGCDCVRKTFGPGNRVLTDMERNVARVNLEKRRAKAEAKRQAALELYQAKLAEQRLRNGGLTDAEVQAQREQNERQAAADKYRAANSWLLQHIEPDTGFFVSEMARELQTRLAAELSERQLDVLRDVYAKKHGRKNTDAWKAARDTFDTQVGEQRWQQRNSAGT